MTGSAPGATPHDRPPAVEALPEAGPRLPRPIRLLPMGLLPRLGRAALSECLKRAPVCACPLPSAAASSRAAGRAPARPWSWRVGGRCSR